MPLARTFYTGELMKNIASYKKILTEEKERLENQLSSIGRRNPLNGVAWEALPQETGKEPDEGDTADIIEGYEENRAILAELETRYRAVLAALERIEKGSYGRCEVPGQKHLIEKERLAADPAAKTCKGHLRGKGGG